MPYDFRTGTESSQTERHYSQYIERLVMHIRDTFERVRDHVRLARLQYKTPYDKRSVERSFYFGDDVLTRLFTCLRPRLLVRRM